jgi:predicted CXXCH cytochrome family protein
MTSSGSFARRTVPIGLTSILLVSGLLAAQQGAGSTEKQPTPASQLPAATNPTPATTQPAEENTNQEWAREQLISGLIGGKHDFTGGAVSGRDLCLPCHTPHLAAVPAPRFDRRTVTTQPLRPFEGIGIELTSWSLLCLGCHDGITAPDVYSSSHAFSATDRVESARMRSSTLRSHPVGVSYPAGSEDFHPVSEVESVGLPLSDGRIQCTTCHDAHNTHHHRAMLRVSNERSRLCLTCHRL